MSFVQDLLDVDHLERRSSAPPLRLGPGDGGALILGRRRVRVRRRFVYQSSSLQIHNYSISLPGTSSRRSTNSRSRSPQLTNENDTCQTSPLPIPYTRAVPGPTAGAASMAAGQLEFRFHCTGLEAGPRESSACDIEFHTSAVTVGSTATRRKKPELASWHLHYFRRNVTC
jgi:hypothetical protein